MSEDKVKRGKIEMELYDNSLPIVKFFGEVKAGDIRFAKVALQRSFRLFIHGQGKKERAAQKEQIVKEEIIIKTEETIANKEKEDANKQRTTSGVESKSRTSTETNEGSGSGDDGQGSGTTVQPSGSGRDGLSIGRSEEVQRPSTEDKGLDNKDD